MGGGESASRVPNNPVSLKPKPLDPNPETPAWRGVTEAHDLPNREEEEERSDHPHDGECRYRTPLRLGSGFRI